MTRVWAAASGVVCGRLSEDSDIEDTRHAVVSVTRVADSPLISNPPVDPSAVEQLELERALELVAQFAVSDVGAERVRQRVPSASVEEIQDELAAVNEMRDIVASKDSFVPQAVADIRQALDRLRVPGSVLELADLASVGDVIRAIEITVERLSQNTEERRRIAALIVDTPPGQLGKKLQNAIDEQGDLRDGASPDLARARKNIRRLRERLVKLLEKLSETLSSEVVSAEGSVTVRGGRYVLPVRREARARVKGLVHDESGSGATLFVEPQEAIALGNDLSVAEAEERRAVLKVLRDLSDTLRPHSEIIEAGWTMCVRIDDLYARARYAGSVDAHLPDIVSAPAPLVVKQGRHPLLLAELDHVVPFDLAIENDETVIVVSGPNTGGKTVLLKAVGLISSLAQSGVIPPVDKGTRLPVFERIFVDIGDHQSIAANLSTFSGHLAAIKRILETANARSLVLLDEFGTGTDPSEGAALAGATLQALCNRGCLTVATTHLNQLKKLASETPGAVNASLQFDVDRLEPTYRVVKGIPGRSYGLAVAQMLGFPADIMQLAEQMQPEADRSMETLLADLEARDRQLSERESTVEMTEAQQAAEKDGLKALRMELSGRADTLERQAHDLEVQGRATARNFLLEARSRVDEALKLAGAAATAGEVKEARRLVEAGIEEEASAMARLEREAVKLGWSVTVGGGKRRRGPVSTGESGERVVRRRREPSPEPRDSTARSEIDVRGLMADEAETAVLKALDEAVVADLVSLRIIHGKGTGALRERISTVLKTDGRVVEFNTPPTNQGGWGVTIAELKS